jgi:hypothetical protein
LSASFFFNSASSVSNFFIPKFDDDMHSNANMQMQKPFFTRARPVAFGAAEGIAAF